MEIPSEIQCQYLERKKRGLEECYQALKQREFTVLEKFGHQLKGNGATFGHPELSFFGRELEASSRYQDLRLIERSLGEISRWLEHRLN